MSRPLKHMAGQTTCLPGPICVSAPDRAARACAATGHFPRPGYRRPAGPAKSCCAFEFLCKGMEFEVDIAGNSRPGSAGLSEEYRELDASGESSRGKQNAM